MMIETNGESYYTSNMPAIQFPYLMDKSFFAKPVICLVNFDRKECNMTPHNQATSTYKVLIENEYDDRNQWEPDLYLPRNMPQYVHHEITCEEIKPGEEFKKVENYFHLTMPQYDKNHKRINQIVKIQKIFYPKLREEFENKLTNALDVHFGDAKFKNSLQYVKLLWHGTGSTDPMIIAKKVDGKSIIHQIKICGVGDHILHLMQIILLAIPFKIKLLEIVRCTWLR